MKKIDLYEIAIKILGLYLVIIVINQLQEVIINLTVWIQDKNDYNVFKDFNQTPILVAVIIGFLALTTLTFFLIFRTKQIAKLICRKTDYEEELKLFANRNTIFEICLVLLGLVTIVLTLPDFLFKLKNYIYISQSNLPTMYFDSIFIITSGIKIGIGIIVIVFSTKISNLLIRKDKLSESKE